MSTHHTHDTLADVIAQGPRSNSIYAVQRPNGTWSIALDLDGIYTTSEDAQSMADFWAEQIARTNTLPVHRGADVPHERNTK